MSRTVPVRTCIGCRERAAKSDLLRVVLDGATTVVPDELGRSPGRGAHLHPRPQCLDIATRRRAFPRAFRVPGPLDVAAVQQWVEVNRPGQPVSPADEETQRKRSTRS